MNFIVAPMEITEKVSTVGISPHYWHVSVVKFFVLHHCFSFFVTVILLACFFVFERVYSYCFHIYIHDKG